MERVDRKPIVWHPAIRPNLMVVGAPGTGKTSTNHTILAQIALYGWPVSCGVGSRWGRDHGE